VSDLATELPSAEEEPGVATMPPLLVLAGPTATGKTELAIRLAETLMGEGTNVEIVSADSRQVFRGLDIGTAKASAEDRARVAHHGLDLVDPDRSFSVADYAAHARAALAGIAERARAAGRPSLAILAGGTGLYLRTIARGLDTDALPADAEIRARIEAELVENGVGATADRLVALAPALASGIDLRNPRRVARALEIAELRGDGPLPPPRGYPAPVAWFGLDLAKRVHDRWITNRARAQFDAGLIEEARALRERFDPGLPAFSAIGYREAWAVIDRESTIEEAIELDAQRNRAFAQRQRTWFRSEPAVRWRDPTKGDVLPGALGAARSILGRP